MLNLMFTVAILCVCVCVCLFYGARDKLWVNDIIYFAHKAIVMSLMTSSIEEQI